jgi:magnesium-transporting ATPase (P-type)
MKELLERDWHAAEVEEVLELSDQERGLSDEEVRKRRDEFGDNTIPTGQKVSLLQIIWHQFKSPLIYVLIAAGILSFVMGEYLDAAFIVLILVVNATIGAWQEWRAETGAQSLQDLIKLKARVKRNGDWRDVEAEELVPGDLISLESGVQVPADARLISVNNLQVEEAMLTGESLPVQKETEPGEEGTTNAGDKKNLVYAGTTALTGRAEGVVIATGLHTEIGKIARSLTEGETVQTPLLERMERFARVVSLVVLVASALLGVIGWYRGMDMFEILFIAVAMAVSAIPEGLPIAMTVALSIGSQRMAKRNVIVRKLSAVEGLGSCTYILSDKTGTLTVDQQTVRKIYLPGEDGTDSRLLDVTGQGYNGEGEIEDALDDDPALDLFIRIATVANEGGLSQTEDDWEHRGDAVDVALLALSYKRGSSPDEVRGAVEIEREIPYESENKYSGAYYRHDGQLYFAGKGAWEIFADTMDSEQKAAIDEVADELAAEGFRVLAMVYAEADGTDSDLPDQLKLAGLVGLIDPIRPEVKDAIAECHGAGIKVAMVTGDHPLTALAIARDIDIAQDKENLISGADLAKIDEDEKKLAEVLSSKTVFARVSPEQKQKLVKAFQSRGEYVAITGDGVNDAPALRQANIGVAMGSGTDVTRGAASIVLKDDNFASIAAGVEEGRFSYENIRKIVYLLISTGIAEVLLVLLSTLFGLPKPLTAIQLLWLNVVTNGIQDVALAFEPGDMRAMKRKPRSPEEGIFDRQMISQTTVAGLVMTAIVMTLWITMLNQGVDEVSGRSDLLLVMVLLQNFHLFNCRSETQSTFRIPLSGNYILLLGLLAAQGIHIAAMHIPLTQRLLETEPNPASEWLTYFGLASIILVVMEIYKWIIRRRRGTD